MSEHKVKEWDKYSSDNDEKVEEEINKKSKNKRKKKQKPKIEEEIEKEEYTPQEIFLINKFVPMAKNSLDEDEVYDLIKKKKL